MQCVQKSDEDARKVNGDPAVDNNAVITVASWFMMKQELSEEGDISLREEDDYMELIKERGLRHCFCRSDDETHD